MSDSILGHPCSLLLDEPRRARRDARSYAFFSNSLELTSFTTVL